MKQMIFTAMICLFISCAKSKEIRVLTDRTQSHLAGIFTEFEKQTGVKVVPNYVGKAFFSRLKERPHEADLIISKNAYTLELAKQQGLLAQFNNGVISANVPHYFRDKDNHYIITTYRSRVIYYSKDRVKPTDLGTYFDLAKPKFKNKVCLRSGYHSYNVSLFAQLIDAYGAEKVEKFLTGLKRNLARKPKGNDRAQVRAIMEGKCDVTIANSYYMGIMLSRDDQKEWARSSRIFFPDQKEKGALVLRSGAALTKAKDNSEHAIKLLEFLSGDYAQSYFSNALYAYPVKEGVEMIELNKSLGKEQGLIGGVFKKHVVPLARISKNKEQVIKFLNKLDFDK